MSFLCKFAVYTMQLGLVKSDLIGKTTRFKRLVNSVTHLLISISHLTSEKRGLRAKGQLVHTYQTPQDCLNFAYIFLVCSNYQQLSARK